MIELSSQAVAQAIFDTLNNKEFPGYFTLVVEIK